MPLPRMEGFPPPAFASSTGGGGGSGGIEGLPSMAPAAAAGPAGDVSVPHAAASGTPPSLEGFPAMAVVGGGGGEGLGGAGGAVAMGGAAAGNAGGGVEFPSSSSLSAGATGSPLPRAGESAQPQPHLVGMATGSPPPAAALVEIEPAAANGEQKEEEEEEDDFGDFAGAQEEAQPPPVPLAGDDEGDDFGDFSGAPTSVDEQALAATTVATGRKGVASATSGGSGGGGDDVAWMMEDGDKEAAPNAHSGMKMGTGGGLDDLIKSNLYPTTAGQVPVHLADMVSTGLG